MVASCSILACMAGRPARVSIEVDQGESSEDIERPEAAAKRGHSMDLGPRMVLIGLVGAKSRQGCPPFLLADAFLAPGDQHQVTDVDEQAHALSEHERKAL